MTRFTLPAGAARALVPVAAAALLAGCAGNQVENVAGTPTVYEDPETTGRVGGVGIESQDVVAMTDEMMRDMLRNRMLAGRDVPPRVIIDNAYLDNESSSVINTNQLTDRLRIELNRAANGRMVFVSRESADMVQQERDAKRDGVVDSGTIRETAAQAGADYRLRGRITSLDAVDRDSQTQSRYTQVTFEMVDLELGTIVWSGLYEMRKAAQDNVLYR
ncbi:hypothetical protein QWY84_06470 [Aquisalimonas lutea]|uniref:hypothetical protein n=1 Tax=Aquisalimonas lutea TaxID=1327750 RepID=UPI0025B4AB83|nr:hypothetical protein [Aquisalimonas lutea]MDN3517245.1 hypothetical protein [Aquisalimonas lutea]